MKSTILKLSGALLGTPLIVTGRGMQYTGQSMHKAADAVVRGGIVVEAAGHATKAEFTDKAEAASAAEEADKLQAELEKVNKTIAKLERDANKAGAKQDALFGELVKLRAARGELEALIAASPAPVAEMLVPAEVAVA